MSLSTRNQLHTPFKTIHLNNAQKVTKAQRHETLTNTTSNESTLELCKMLHFNLSKLKYDTELKTLSPEELSLISTFSRDKNGVIEKSLLQNIKSLKQAIEMKNNLSKEQILLANKMFKNELIIKSIFFNYKKQWQQFRSLFEKAGNLFMQKNIAHTYATLIEAFRIDCYSFQSCQWIMTFAKESENKELKEMLTQHIEKMYANAPIAMTRFKAL